MFKKLITLSIFLFFPASAFAATNIPDSQLIYTWGYGNIMNDILQAVKGMTTEADYIIKAAMTLAFFIFAIQKALSDKLSPVFEFGKFLLLYGVIYFFFLNPANTSKNQFMIHDEVTSKDYVVSQVPMGIGYTLSLMSRFERVMLKGMEKHFSTPDSTAYSQAGLGFSLSSMMDLPTIRIQKTNPDVQMNINNYVRNCLQYDTLSGKIAVYDIHTSDDLMNILFPTNNSKLTVYYETSGGTMNDSLISCGEAAQGIKEAIATIAGAKEVTESHIANVGTVAEWRNKFNGVANIFFGQAKGAREQLQQMILINALDDGVRNTASVLGLDPQSLGANAAIAEQSFIAGMQAQGKLAQTYLPIAKAYFTAIIVGLSWLMAILSIMFGTYQYIKMFFTLCLFLVLWTPILSIINYLNDLTLQHTFELTNADIGAITYSSYQDVFQAVASHSSYINYLVMLTPILAYALAKGSEMGFVSLASGLSQQLAGSARAASSFAQQQGLSTKAEISTPRGEEVYALGGGISSVQSAFYDSQGNLTSTNIKQGLGGGADNSQLDNAVFKGTNVGGMMQGASFTAGTMTTANSASQSLSENWDRQFSDSYGKMNADGRATMLNTAKSFIEQGNESFTKSYASNLASEISHNQQLSDSEKANITAYAKAQLGGEFFGSGVVVGTEGKATKEWSSTDTLSDTEKAAYNNMAQRASAKTLATSEGIDTSWQNSLRGENSTAFQDLRSHGQAYAEQQASIQAIQSNNADNILNVHARDLAANDGYNFSNLDTATQNKYFAEAGHQINDMLKNNPAQLATLNQQVGAGMTTQGNTFSTRAEGISFKNVNGSDMNVLQKSNSNRENVQTVGDNVSNSSSLPSEQQIKTNASQGNNVAKLFDMKNNDNRQTNNAFEKGLTGSRPFNENLGI